MSVSKEHYIDRNYRFDEAEDRKRPDKWLMARPPNTSIQYRINKDNPFSLVIHWAWKINGQRYELYEEVDNFADYKYWRDRVAFTLRKMRYLRQQYTQG
jgi:hypothetical protein